MARNEKQPSSTTNGNGQTSLPGAGSGSASLAVIDEAALAAVGGTDLLAGIEGIEDIVIDDDGIGEVAAEEIKIPRKLFNMKGIDAKGDPIPKNVFFDSIAETTQKELHAILIKRKYTNEWREYDPSTDKSTTHCRSLDQIKGVMENGTIRPCKGCPDAKWESRVDPKDGKTKRMRRCSPVANVYGAELPSMQPFLIRFKKTSLAPWQTHLSRYFIRKRRIETKTGIEWANYPLYAFTCKLTLKMDDKAVYAFPVFEQGSVLPAKVIKQGAETVKYVDAVFEAELARLIDQDPTDDSVDTTFDTSTMGGGEGKDFVDAPQDA